MKIYAITVTLLLCTVLLGQDFNLLVAGSEDSYTIPIDTNYRMIYLDDLAMSQSDPAPIFNLTFTFPDSLPTSVEYKILGFMHSTSWDEGSDDTLNFEAYSFSNGDSLWIEEIEFNSELVWGIRYLNNPGDELSGFSLELNSDSSFYTSDHLKFWMSADTLSNWLNFMPLAMGNVWKYSGPLPVYGRDRWEVIDTSSVAHTSYFTIAREREYLEGYGEGIEYDTALVYNTTSDAYKIYTESGSINPLAMDFRPSEDIPFGEFEGIAPQNDGTVDFTYQVLGGSTSWKYGVGYSANFGDGFGQVSGLIGYTINGVTYGDTSAVVGIDDHPDTLPTAFQIKAYPNPFNPTTTIEYEIPAHSEVSMIVYDINGREVQTLVSRSQSSGNYQVSWGGLNHDGTQVSGGMYFARLQAGEYSSVVKMVYLR